MAHQVQIKELVNGIEITENLDGVISVSLLSYNSRPFFRTTNETDEESYQVLDALGEIYHLPALATEFILIDLEGNYWQPDNGTELIEYSYKIRAFRPENEFDRVLSIGSIETTSSSVTVNIPGVGLAISLLMNGSIYSRYYPFIANYTPIVGTSGEQKILIVYGKPDSQVLYLAQGAEALEAVEPSYDGLFVARIIVSAEGQTVETERFDLKYITSDGWRQITINTTDPATIYMAGNLASSFDINSNVSAPVIGLISAKAGRPFWDGSEFWIKNSSAYDLTLEPTALADVGIYQTITFAETTIVKPGIWVKIKIKNGVLEVANNPSDYALDSELDLKADKTTTVNGKPLSANVSLTTTDINEGTNLYFTAARVLATVLTGISFITGTPVVSTDTVLVAFGKLQKQITDILASITDLYIHQITIVTTSSITTDTLGAIASGGTSNLLQHGRNVKISNGVNAINLSCETSSAAAFVASYTKIGSATITFTAGTGATLVQVDGTAVLNGVVGSTACLTRSGNTFYLQISNR